METMDHTEAIRMKATEQYLLGEMPATLRDEFEEHFMDCADCARDIRAGAALMGNLKDALKAEPVPAAAPLRLPDRRESWLAAFFRPAIAAPALAILLAIVGYQSLVEIPRIQSALSTANAPGAITSFSLLSGSSRGEASVPVVVRRDQPFTLYVDVPPQPGFPLYTLEVESASGASQFSVPVSADAARNTVQVLVPQGRLAPGDYVMVIGGASSQANSSVTEVGRMRFSVKYSN
jgi:anti-sigma factor RsiW